MIRSLFALAIGLMISVVISPAQRSQKGSVSKPSAGARSTKPAPFAEYTFSVDINADGSSQLTIDSAYNVNLDSVRIKQALTEYVTMQTPGSGRKPVGPKVIIHPYPTLELKTVLDYVKASRVAESATVTILMNDLLTLDIPSNPDFADQRRGIKPNPLTLVVAIANDNTIALNNEQYGNRSDFSQLTNKLKDVFRAREENGVFREGTNEIEKSVSIRIPLSAKIADLEKIAEVLDGIGARPLTLLVDDSDPSVDVRKPIILLKTK